MAVVRLGTLLTLFVCLAEAQFGWLHHHPKKDLPEGATLGVVVSKRPDSFVLRAIDTRVITFKLGDSTRYFHGDRWISATRLTRGAVVRVESSADIDGLLTATDVVFEDTTPVFKPRVQADSLLDGGVKDDPRIETARNATNNFFRLLPNFLCQQSTTRSYAGPDKKWHTVDQVTAEVVYDHGHDSYRDVKLNGRPTGRSMMDLPGSRSTGEFGSTLRALFDPETDAVFKFADESNLGSYSTSVYDFAVSGDQSDWRITAGSQTILAPYIGRIWIEHESGNVVRIEMKAMDIPGKFPFQRVEAEVDYGPVALPSGRYFLPARAENLSCNDPNSCSRNVIEFRNYHKYVGESSISFDAPPTLSQDSGEPKP